MKRQLLWFSFLTPALLIYGVFFLIPLYRSMEFGFFKWEGIARRGFAGLYNFRIVLEDGSLWHALKNNLITTSFVLVVQTVIALVLALLVYKGGRKANAYKFFYFMPIVLSTVSVGFAWSYLYHPSMGPINAVLKAIGWENAPHWLSDPDIAMLSVAWVMVWQHAGYEMLFFVAGLQAIPEELFESCKIEGASAWQTFTKITLPLLQPVTALAVVLTTVGSFKVFELIYVMTAGGPFSSTKVLAFEIYEQAFKYNEIGRASALSLVLFLLLSLISALQLYYFRNRYDMQP